MKSYFLVMLGGVILSFSEVSLPALGNNRNWNKTYLSLNLCSKPSFSEILPGLYLANARAACNRQILRSLNISHILTIETRKLPKSTFEGTNIKNLYIRANDVPSTDLMSYFPMTYKFIEEGMKDGNIIVHCHIGVSRSATIVIAYLMQKYDISYEEALDMVRSKRSFVNPNVGFVKQLKLYRQNRYTVNGFRRLEAYVKVKASTTPFKLASFAAVMIVGVFVPVAVLILVHTDLI